MCHVNEREGIQVKMLCLYPELSANIKFQKLKWVNRKKLCPTTLSFEKIKGREEQFFSIYPFGSFKIVKRVVLRVEGVNLFLYTHEIRVALKRKKNKFVNDNKKKRSYNKLRIYFCYKECFQKQKGQK